MVLGRAGLGCARLGHGEVGTEWRAGLVLLRTDDGNGGDPPTGEVLGGCVQGLRMRGGD